MWYKKFSVAFFLVFWATTVVADGIQPRLTAIEDQLLSLVEDYKKRIKGLEEEVTELKLRIATQHIETGTISMAAKNTRDLTDRTKCPAGSTGDAYRGMTNGYVSFTKPFEQVPQVHISMRDFDIQGRPQPVKDGSVDPDSHRVHINVRKRTKSGFYYSFVTWCSTAVHSARAQWLAFSID